MSSNSDTVKQEMEEIKHISKDLRELVYSAPSQWLWDSIGSAVSIDQIAEGIEKIESSVQKIREYCDAAYKEVTDTLLAIMWSGLQTKNYEAILQALKQLNSIEIDFENEPFNLKPK
jgi:methyl-accepting chemotaxis protein